MQRRVHLAAIVLGACVFLGGCEKRELTLDRAGGVQVMMPLGSQHSVTNDPSDGLIEEMRPGKWTVELAWEPDPRRDPVTDEQALLVWGNKTGRVVVGAKPIREIVGNDAQAMTALAVNGHPAALVHGAVANSEALIWRCEKSGRLFELKREGTKDPGIALSTIAQTVRCHDFGTRPADASLPSANLMELGEGWTLGRRTHETAVYLRSDALLTLFAGRKTQPTDDLVLAAHLAPSWIEAAGLKDAHVETGDRTNGPQGHPAIALRGEAMLDGAKVRFTYLEWRCLQHARTYGALLVGQEPAAQAPAAPTSPTDATATRAGWTGYDSALLAVRCHG